MYFLKSRFIETKTHKKTILMKSCLQYVQWHNIEHELFLVPTTIKHRRETSSHAFYIFVQVVYTEYKAKPNFRVPRHTHKSVLLKRYLKISLRLLSSKTHSPPSGQILSLIYWCLGHAEYSRMLFLWLITNDNFLVCFKFFFDRDHCAFYHLNDIYE